MAHRFDAIIRTRFAQSAKFAFAALMALSFLFAQSLVTEAFADKRPKDYGRVKIFVPIHDPVKNPDGYPILVDGQDYGNTTPNQRTLQLASGRAHTIEIIFPDNKRWTRDVFINAGRIYCIGVEYTPFVPPVITETPCPPCAITLEASSNVKQGDPITVNANIDYKGPMDDLTYTWTVSPGSATILSGGGPRDRSVTFDSAGINERELRVTLVVDNGYPPDQRCGCKIATAVTGIDFPEPEPDRFQFVAFDELKARLDNFVIDLQSNKDATAYIVYYSGNKCPAGQASRLGERSREYLVNERNFDPNRLVIIDGGQSTMDWLELYVVKLGGKPPTPRPNEPPAMRADLGQYPCIQDPTTRRSPRRSTRPSRRRR